MPKKVKETYPKIGEMLVRKQLVDPEQIEEALALQRADLEQNKTPRRLGEILVRKRILDRRIINEILEEQRLYTGEKRELKVDLRERDGIVVVTLAGRLDQPRDNSLIRIFERLMNRGIIAISVDCSQLVYLNSHGASAFVSYIDEARSRGGDVKFFALNANCRLTLDRLGLNKFIQLFDSEDEAVNAFAIPTDEYLSRGALGEYIASERGRYFHLSYCPAAQKVSDASRVYYESKWHARRAGKNPCKRCRP